MYLRFPPRMLVCISSPRLPHLKRSVGAPVQIDYMFDSARKSLELAAWNRLRKPWASAMDVETGRKFYYNTRTLESRWFMPILERQTGVPLTQRLLRGHVVCLFTVHLRFTLSRNDSLLTCYVASCAVMSVSAHGPVTVAYCAHDCCRCAVSVHACLHQAASHSSLLFITCLAIACLACSPFVGLLHVL